MLELLKQVMGEIANDPEYFALMAKCMRKMYVALVSAGFTSEEAMQIVVAHGTGVKNS